MSATPNLSNSGASNSVSLKVLEGYTRDVGRAVARIDPATMDALGVSTGFIIEIKQPGKERRATVAKVLPLYPSDEGKGIIRIDGLIRNNAGTSIGQEVAVGKVNAAQAERLVLAPVEPIPPIDPRYIANALESVPVSVGDNVMVPYFGGRLTFKVLGIAAHNDGHTNFDNVSCVIVTVKTLILLVQDSGSAITVSINEYVRQEPVIDKTFASSGSIENKSLAFFLGFRLELLCANVADRIDYQRKISLQTLENVSQLARKYIDIAKAEVKNTNAKIEEEIIQAKVSAHENADILTALRDDNELTALRDDNDIGRILRDLKYSIVKKWAMADAEET